jgi:mycothiol S-conjugate amidase
LRRLLAVHAHPDDESSKGAATYAHYRSTGAEVMVVSCTGGEQGSVLNPNLAELAMAERDIGGLRYIEMARAKQVLGIEHRWLGYLDSGLPENGQQVEPNRFAAIPLELSGPALVKVLREFRPHVLISYDENGGYPHPDHIRAHEISVWAIEAAADGSRHRELGEPWSVSKHYYDRVFSADRTNAVYAAIEAADPLHPLLDELRPIKEWMGERGGGGTTRVPCGDFFETRDAALRAHASQVAPDSPFFFWPNDVQRVAWPWEEFELVRSSVPTEMPETDLFAGIEE